MFDTPVTDRELDQFYGEESEAEDTSINTQTLRALRAIPANKLSTKVAMEIISCLAAQLQQSYHGMHDQTVAAIEQLDDAYAMLEAS